MRETSDTPLVAVDLDAVERNIERMQRRAERLGLALRPHVKTHKLPLLAHRQLAAGAVGVACQKLSEAEVMASSGVGPILITYPLIGEVKWRRAARLAAEFELEFCADSEFGVEGLSRHLPADREHLVRVDCDTGRWRTGVPEPADALRLARSIEAKPNLRFAGLITHPAPAAAAEWFAEARDLFAEAGIGIPAVSVGGTPGVFDDPPGAVYEVATELRVGTYIYGDRACIASGSSTEEQCALRVRATVVSRPSPTRAIIDAGSKVLSSDAAEGLADGCFGLVVGHPEITIPFLSEEHGHLDMSACPGALEVGQPVDLIPNHACAVTNLADSVQLRRSGRAIGWADVLARGATT